MRPFTDGDCWIHGPAISLILMRWTCTHRQDEVADSAKVFQRWECVQPCGTRQFLLCGCPRQASSATEKPMKSLAWSLFSQALAGAIVFAGLVVVVFALTGQWPPQEMLVGASSAVRCRRSPVVLPTDACRWSDKPTAGERRPERTFGQFDPSFNFHRARYGSWQTPIGSGVTSGTNSGFSENFPKVSSGVHRKSIIAFDTPSMQDGRDWGTVEHQGVLECLGDIGPAVAACGS